jgi:hypothetical protein
VEEKKKVQKEEEEEGKQPEYRQKELQTSS